MERPDLEEWETYAELYDRNKGSSGDEFARTLFDPALLELVGATRDREVIDAGCGNGYLSAALADDGARSVMGLDGSSSLVVLARKRFAGTAAAFLHHDLMEPWPVPVGSADLVVANMVLQYLPDVSTFAAHAAHAAQALLGTGSVIASIDHPVHALVMRTARLMGATDSKFTSDVPYLETAQCTKRSLWGQAELTYFHRPLSAYTEAFFSNGFVLTGFHELGREEAIGNVTDEIPRITVLRFGR